MFLSGCSIFSQRYFPASGFRSADEDGAFKYVSAYGYYWASSIFASDSIFGAFLRAHTGVVSPFGAAWRADAFPVRCVQAFTVYFLPSPSLGERPRGRLLKRSGSPFPSCHFHLSYIVIALTPITPPIAVATAITIFRIVAQRYPFFIIYLLSPLMIND